MHDNSPVPGLAATAPTKRDDAEYVNDGPSGQRCEFIFLVDEPVNLVTKPGSVRVFSARGKKCGLHRDSQCVGTVAQYVDEQAVAQYVDEQAQRLKLEQPTQKIEAELTAFEQAARVVFLAIAARSLLIELRSALSLSPTGSRIQVEVLKTAAADYTRLQKRFLSQKNAELENINKEVELERSRGSTVQASGAGEQRPDKPYATSA